MLKNYLKSKRTCEHYYRGTSGPYLDDFVEWMSKQGYQYQTIRRRVRGAVRFSQWNQSKGSTIPEMNVEALSVFEKFLARQGKLRNTSGDYLACFLGARNFLYFLQAQGITIIAEMESTPAYPEMFYKFRSWMLTHRGVAESTLDGYRAIVIDLLARIGDQPAQYTAKTLREFVLHRVHHHNPKSAQNVISAIRMFLQFLVVTGRLEAGLEGAIPNVASWRLQTLPRWLPAKEIERVIVACDSSTAIGARDRAVVLLLAHLGLRAGEIATLCFDDIDWNNATLKIRDKCRRESRLPLPQTVGDALLHYLDQFRPSLAAIEQIFITTVAPYRPLRRVTVSQIATRALRRAGIVAPVLGAHMFRHSVATTLLNEGASMQTIAILLRHTSLESTRIYTKIDQGLLREVTLPWSEVMPC